MRCISTMRQAFFAQFLCQRRTIGNVGNDDLRAFIDQTPRDGAPHLSSAARDDDDLVLDRNGHAFSPLFTQS